MSRREKCCQYTYWVQRFNYTLKESRREKEKNKMNITQVLGITQVVPTLLDMKYLIKCHNESERDMMKLYPLLLAAHLLCHTIVWFILAHMVYLHQ